MIQAEAMTGPIGMTTNTSQDKAIWMNAMAWPWTASMGIMLPTVFRLFWDALQVHRIHRLIN